MLWPVTVRLGGWRPVFLSALVAIVACAAAVPIARGCDTPVYRFAMYNWINRADYQVYYVYHGRPDEADSAVNARLEALAVERPAAANVVLKAINAEDEVAMKALPSAVFEAWQAWPELAQPVHLVFSPRGTLVGSGRLDEAEVSTLVNSPARTRLAEMLHQGHTGVLIELTGVDEEMDVAPDEVVGQVIQQGREGRIRPFSLFATTDADEEGTTLDIGRLTVRRDDPAERWFVRTLLQVESDLTEDPRPMVFPAYGRGRVMEPYIGRGITVENLTSAVAFVTGACSCEVQEQNPGVELLTRWDWDAAALAVAERYGAEEGNEHLLGREDLISSILISTGDAPRESPAADTKPVADGGTNAESVPAEDALPGDNTVGEQAAGRADAALDQQAPADQSASTARQGRQKRGSPRASFGTTMSRNFAVLAAIACVGLLLVGLFLMRSRN